MITERKFQNGINTWININSDTVGNDSDLYKQYGIDSELIHTHWTEMSEHVRTMMMRLMLLH